MTAKDIVIGFLSALEARDLSKASGYLTPEAVMTFPGDNKFSTLPQLVEWSKNRYKFVRKTYKAFDEMNNEGVAIVYCRGVLNGEWLDGSIIKDVRFIDRFEIKNGMITDQQVWNDLSEFMP